MDKHASAIGAVPRSLIFLGLLAVSGLVYAQDPAADGLSLRVIFTAILTALMGGVGWRLIRDAMRLFVEDGRALLNPAISQELRATLAEAIRVARIAAGGPAGACESAKLSLIEQLGNAVRGVEDNIGRGASRFQHEFVVLKESGHVLDPVARQAVERRLATWAELEARGLRGAVQEGIFTAEQWQAFKELETTKAGQRAARLATIGRVLIGIGVVISVINVVTAPEGQRGLTAAIEVGAWGTALAFGELGVWIGTSLGGPPGALIGGLAGVLIGAAVGSAAAGSLWERIFGKPEETRVSTVAPAEPTSPVIGCDCMGLEAGLLTGPWRKECMAQELNMLEVAGSARTSAEAASRLGLTADPAGNINGGLVCNLPGPAAWPIYGAPISGPTGPVNSGGQPCNPSGLAQECEDG